MFKAMNAAAQWVRGLSSNAADRASASRRVGLMVLSGMGMHLLDEYWANKDMMISLAKLQASYDGLNEDMKAQRESLQGCGKELREGFKELRGGLKESGKELREGFKELREGNGRLLDMMLEQVKINKDIAAGLNQMHNDLQEIQSSLSQALKALEK